MQEFELLSCVAAQHVYGSHVLLRSRTARSLYLHGSCIGRHLKIFKVRLQVFRTYMLYVRFIVAIVLEKKSLVLHQNAKVMDDSVVLVTTSLYSCLEA